MSKYITLPNILTISRFLIVPFIIWYLFHEVWVSAMFLFVIAVVTDFLDGFIARLTDTQTDIGRIMDPIADKILIVGIISFFVFGHNNVLKGFDWLFWVLFGKELLLIFGGIALWLKGAQKSIRPHVSGKVAMAIQAGAIFILFILMVTNQMTEFFRIILSMIIVAVNLIAFYFYIKRYFIFKQYD